jgi:Skp family chaperone for outer membrane proteins
MGNLADLFLQKFSTATSPSLKGLKLSFHNAGIQEASSQSFVNMREISMVSAEGLARMQQMNQAIFADFGAYLQKLGNMSDALTENLSSFTKTNEFMRANSEVQMETIKILSEYEKELSQVSNLYTSTMQTVISEIKDQYSSTMNFPSGCTVDMLKFGQNHLRSAYGEFASSTVADIEQIFKHFDENLTSISAHLATSIADLQDAVDELPVILKAIQVNPEKEAIHE